MKVCLMEMDERTRQSIALVFKHRTDEAVVIADESEAEIAVLDLDRADALQNYRSARARRPGCRGAIGLASDLAIPCDDIMIVHKPISAGSLLEAIQRLSGNSLQLPKIKAASAAASLGERTRSARRRPELVPQTAASSFDPAEYLLGSLLHAAEQARQNDLSAVIRLPGGHVIVLDPRAKLLHTNCSLARVLSLFALGGTGGGAEKPVVDYLAHEEAKALFSGQTYGIPAEQLMWKLGAATSRGCLPEGLSLDERVYLRRWPNMTHLACLADTMRIVAYWMRGPASAREIAEALDVSEQAVCVVYTAAYAAGLVGKARREVDRVWEAPAVEAHQERNVFSSILRKLLQRRPGANDEAGASEELAA